MSDSTVEEFTVGLCNVRIEYDTDPLSPSEFDDKGLFIVAKHRDFYVPEPGEKRCPEDPQELVDNWKKTHWIFPLEAYIHGGVSLAFGREGNFPDRRWDVSRVGFVFASKKEWRLSRKAREAAKCKIDEWNRYLSGQTYGYIVELPEKVEIVTYSGGPGGPHRHTNWSDEESCWGFDDLEYCKQEATSVAERLSAKIEATERETAMAEVFP